MSNNTNVLGGGNLCVGKAGLVAGTTTTLTSAAVSIVILGKYYTIAAATNGAATTTDGITGLPFAAVPIGGNQVYVICYNAAAARKVVQGPVTTGFPAASGGLAVVDFPNLPDELCPIGYVLVQIGTTGSAWTWGTSNLSGVTGVTYTFQDVAYLPARPPTI